jgi:hypothetical protein
LEDLEGVWEPGDTRPAFVYRDLLLLYPFDLVDILPIDLFLLQEELIFL